MLIRRAWGVLLALLLLSTASHSLRQGDSLNVRAIGADGSSTEFPGVTLCVDNYIELRRPIKTLIFEDTGYSVTDLPSPRAEVVIEVHEANIRRVTVHPYQPNQNNDDLALKVTWARCTFEVDEVLPLQLLLSLGSVLSIGVLLFIILDSRPKRVDKFY